ERPRAVEDAARLDLAVQDVRHQLLDVRARGRRAAADRDVVRERLDRVRDRLVLWVAHPADGAAGARDPHGRPRRLVVADALEGGIDAEAVRELAHAFDRFVSALADDVASAELPGQRRPGFVAAEDDDLLGPEPFRRDHAADADGAVADDGHELT